MASSQATMAPPSTLTRVAYKRSVTVPTKLHTSPAKAASVEIGAAEGIETLYVHPSAKVVSFTTASHPITSSRRVSEGDSVGTLPWRTSTERTLAAGFLEIYRVPGSVSFLHSGSLLHAILPRSQCWCVDGVSVFAFRVLPNQYYRIELPGQTEEDLAQVEELKLTLQRVLHYERTACPFVRGFSVDLPSTPPPPPSRRSSRFSTEPVKKWKLDGIWRPEDGEEPTLEHPKTDTPKTVRREQQSVEASPLSLRFADRQSESNMADDEEEDVDTPKPRRPSNLSGLRSITAPPKLTLIASPPSKLTSSITSSLVLEVPVEDARSEPVDEGISEEAVRSDSVKHIESKAPQARPSSEDMAADLREAQSHDLVEDGVPMSAISQFTDPGILSEDDMIESRVGVWSNISTPSLSSDSEGHSWADVKTPPETIRVKKSRKAPDARAVHHATSTSLLRKTSRESQKAIADGLVSKTYGVFLGPPANLVSMMLKIAARITNGAFSFTVRSPMDSPRRVPGSWILAEDGDEWDVDDFAASPSKRGSKAAVHEFPGL